jgi:SAM domain (Sterile alpha motif)
MFFFLDNEITGRVLLKLDVNLLKSEIGITAFGKRIQIMDFIADLC